MTVLRRSVETTDLTGGNQWTPVTWISPSSPCEITVSGTFSGTLSIQRTYADDRAGLSSATWVDVPPRPGGLVSGGIYRISQPTRIGMFYRVGFRTADYVSGTATVRMET